MYKGVPMEMLPLHIVREGGWYIFSLKFQLAL
jgi:hypothetical protein